MDRRTFLTQTAGYAAGLSLLASPGIMTEAWAARKGKTKEEIFKELEARAEKFLPQLKTCSQASFATLNEQFGLKAEQAVPALMPFAGGIAGKGETCGAVSGSLLALGFFFASRNAEGTKKPVSPLEYGRLFFDGFAREFSSTRCREVVKYQFGRYYDFQDPEDMKLFMLESEKRPKCLEVVKRAVCIAGDIVLKNL